jgi:hypothetical protein
MRRQGKSTALKELVEKALDAGKTVCFVNSEGSSIHKKYGNFTLITPLKKTEITKPASYDDFSGWDG